MTTVARRAILLIRVSDARQEKEGLSLNNQEQTLRRYAEANGFQIEKEFRFQETADFKLRKRFHELVRYIRERNKVQAIIAYRVDRMTRNYHDHVLLDDLRLSHGKELHFVYDHLVITPSSVGREIQDWDTKVYLAKMYLNRLKEDAVTSLAYKLSIGELPGKAPFGYTNVKRNHRGWVEIDPMKAKIVSSVFEWYGAGSTSMERVRARVLQEYGFKMSQGWLDRILKNPFYFGEMQIKGRRHRHVYEPIITRARFEQVQARKAAFHKQPHKFAGLPFLFRGLITCADCGCAVTPERKRKPSGREFIYYHCTNYRKEHDPVWVSEAELMRQVQSILAGLRIPREQHESIVKTLKESHEGKTRIAESKRANLTSELTRLQKRIEVLYEDRLDGIITKEVYQERSDRYQQELREAEDKLDGLGAADVNYYMCCSVILDMCANVCDVFAKADFERQRTLLNFLLQNCRLKQRTLLWELNKPFDAVFDCVDSQRWLPLVNAFRHQELSFNIDREQLISLSAALELAPGALPSADQIQEAT